jgi:hypothetical protein
MHRPLKPKDLIAPILLWALVLTGCVIGDVRPVHRVSAIACVP